VTQVTTSRLGGSAGDQDALGGTLALTWLVVLSLLAGAQGVEPSFELETTMVRLLPPARSGWLDNVFPAQPLPWLVIMMVIVGGWTAEQTALILPVLLVSALIMLVPARFQQQR
jgi:hypothetical protein